MPDKISTFPWAQEGRTTKEILRCLKRHLIREIYQVLVAPHKERKLAIAA